MRRPTALALVALAGIAIGCSDDDDDDMEDVSSTVATTTSPPGTSTTVAVESTTTSVAAPSSTPPPIAIEDTMEFGGTALYRVDLRTGTAEPLGTVGTEVGVLGLTVDRDGSLVGLTDVPDLVRFSADDPATIASHMPLSGIDGTLLALDRRADGTLFAIGDAGVLVTLDPVTGAATPVGDETVPVVDPGIGFDVDPPSSRVVFTDAVGVHQFIHPETAATTAQPSMAYVRSDVNAGTVPRIVAVAVAGDSTRFAVDAATASLVTLATDGMLRTVGPLGIDVTDGASLDIAPDGQAFLTSPG